MAKGVLGIESVPPVVSDKPDIVPATQEIQFNTPRQEAISIYPGWDQALFGAQEQFLRYPISVVSQIQMGKWDQNGTFAKSPGVNRKWNDSDICRPEMLAKYPQLESSLLYLLGVIQQEEQEAGVI